MPVYKIENKTKDGRQFLFQVSYKTTDGKYKNYRSKLFLTKREAEQQEAIFMLNQGKETSKPITFDNIIVEYLNDKQQELKPQSYRRLKTICEHISNQVGTIVVDKMTKAQYEAFRYWITTQNWSISQKNKLNNYLKTLIKFTDLKYDITNKIPFKYGNFVDKTATIKEMLFYTEQEFNAFMDVVDDIKYQALFLTLFYVGLRIGEANALLWTDLDLGKGILSVNKTVSTKMRGIDTKYLITTPKTSGSIRTIPIAKRCLNALKMLREYYEKFEGFNTKWYVFGGIFPIPETTITKAKSKYAKLSNQKEIRIHDFRHSCASYYIHKGASPAVLAKLLGHSSIKMTLDTYSSMYQSDLNELIKMVE